MSGQTLLTAAHCAKTLVLSSSSGSPILRQCARLLIPGLIEFIAKMAPLIHDGSISEAQGAAIGEVWKAFAALLTATAEEHCECIHTHSPENFSLTGFKAQGCLVSSSRQYPYSWRTPCRPKLPPRQLHHRQLLSCFHLPRALQQRSRRRPGRWTRPHENYWKYAFAGWLVPPLRWQARWRRSHRYPSGLFSSFIMQ